MLPAAAHAQFPAGGGPGELPRTVKPIHYALDLAPDLDALTFAGSERVDIDVLAPTDRLVLNAVDLTFAAASLDGVAAIAIEPDAAAQTVTLAFARPVTAGRHWLAVSYAGRINRFGRGLFMVDYPTESGRKRMMSSQLEPADARRIFPGWDEPAFKASFALTVTVPERFLAVSNMPVAQEEPAGSGLKRVAFETTPRMSSYLFVLAMGELERSTVDVGGTTIGVVAATGKSRYGRYALDTAAELLRTYNDYFGLAYPLPKLDLIAVPGGFGGAMENWGGITFFESRLLFDPTTNPPDARRGIFAIIAHEMAHQWFGDLVTMAWWNDLWLNEGFASWMQAKVAEHLHPEWQTWLNAGGGKQGAMSEDARRTSHPIQQPVANETEANVAFDTITYVKGEWFIRMLESYLGEDAFAAGIRIYMRRHAFGNSTTEDLWQALAEASGKPVATIAAAYTRAPGVPLVVARTRCEGDIQRIALAQERFSLHDPDAKPLHWQVPILYAAIDASGTGKPASVLLDGTAEVAAGRCGTPVKLNLGDVGYYRVQYDDPSFAALTADNTLSHLAAADRVNLLADRWALVEAGRAPPAAFLDLAARLAHDDSRAVADAILRSFGRIDHLEQGRATRTAFEAYARGVLRPAFERLGWDAAPGEGADRAILRARIVATLGDYGDAAIIAEAKRRFAAYLADPASLPTELRATVIRFAGRTADRATYDTLVGLARKSTNTDERVRYYSAAAGALDPQLARETLAITLTDELPQNLVGALISQVASAGEHRELAWQFVREHFDALAARQGPSFRDNFAASLLGNFTDAAHAAELADFAPAQATSGGRIVAARTYERIMTDADFTARQLPAIEAWVAQHRGPG